MNIRINTRNLLLSEILDLYDIRKTAKDLKQKFPKTNVVLKHLETIQYRVYRYPEWRPGQADIVIERWLQHYVETNYIQNYSTRYLQANQFIVSIYPVGSLACYSTLINMRNKDEH